MTADARIDNRRELRTTLHGHVRHPLETDADLILASYECWGQRCVDHLIGDFAFAIWDAERAELFVARDPCGMRPAFYATTENGFVAASTIQSVLAVIDGSPTIDEDYLIGYLADVTPRDRTIWNGIRRLAPGESLVANESGTRVWTYWQPDLDSHDLSLTETAETVRRLFDDAVECRMRTTDGVSSQLSGGFDSTTVTATAARFTTDLQAVSLIYPDFPGTDESAHIDAAAAHIGLDPHRIDGGKLAPSDPSAWSTAFGEPLYSADAPDTAACLEAAAASGRSVLLIGGGGDDLLYGSETATFDLVMQRRLVSAYRWAANDGLSSGAATAYFARSMLGSVVRRSSVLRRLRERQRVQAAQVPWLRTDTPPPPTPRAWIPRGRSERLTLFTDRSWAQYPTELTNCLAAQSGVEVRDPFTDRRFVEFILRTPEEHIRVGGRYRGLHRIAFRDRLPATLLSRTDKAEFSGPYLAKIYRTFTDSDAIEAFEALGDRIAQESYLRGFRRQSDAFAVADVPFGFYLWAGLSAGTFLSTHGSQGNQ
ncbi:asparagine synthetase B [Smaragdicoccus niigatensis]